MTSPVQLELYIKLNGGAPLSGVVTAAYSDSVVLAVASTGTGAKRVKYRIRAYPPGFACPAGWTTEGKFYVATVQAGGDAPAFALPTALSALWGKFIFDATRDGQLHNGRVVSEYLAKARLKIPSVSGVDTIAYLEDEEFDATIGWTKSLDSLARRYEEGIPGTGDVSGPGSSVSGRIALFNGISGNSLQQSTRTVAEIQYTPYNVAIYGAVPGASAATNRVGMQAAIDAARAAGGGRVFFPPGVYALDAPYRDVDGIYPGYVADDEMRRANKALIIYDADNITLDGPGAVLDRSGDIIADISYAAYSTTLYISKSRNITVVGLNFLGIQDDVDLLNDIKSTTSGNHIQINNDCHNIVVDRVIGQDGSTLVEVGIGRTQGFSQLNPAILACTEITLTNLESRNNEQGIILARAYGVTVSNFTQRRFTRADLTTGVTQRPIYLHSCRDVNLTNIFLYGSYKTALMIRNYEPVLNVRVTNFVIDQMMTDAEVIAMRGSALPTQYDGIGIQFISDNCNGVSFSRGKIRARTGVQIPGVGIKNVTFDDVEINAVSSGFYANDSYMGDAILLDNPMQNLVLRDVRITVFEDATNYPGITPNAGLYIDSFAVDGGAAIIRATGIDTIGVKVYSRNRNGRLFNCDGVTRDCDFTRDMTGGGLAGARNYDLNYSGVRRISGNRYGNHGRPNTVQDLPVTPVQGFVALDEPAQLPSFTVATVPSAALHSGRLIQVSNGYDGSPCLAWSDGTSWWVFGTRIGKIASATPTLTIAAGVVTVSASNDIAVDTEAAAASDDLDTINGTVHGQILVVRAVDSARTIVLKDDTGNLRLEGDCSLDHANDRIVLRSNGTSLHEVSRSNNGT
jgi:hypothetical protein